jgi:hypothetical protein
MDDFLRSSMKMKQIFPPPPSRWRGPQGGRRRTDGHSSQDVCVETRLEVGRLKAAIDTLADAVQALATAQAKA